MPTQSSGDEVSGTTMQNRCGEPLVAHASTEALPGIQTPAIPGSAILPAGTVDVSSILLRRQHSCSPI